MRYLPATILLAGLLWAPCTAQAQAPNSLLLGSPAQATEPADKPAEAAGPVVDGATLDPAHTSAVFWIRHVIAPVAGRFDAVAGSVDIPPGNPAKGRVAFTVQTKSVDTGVAARDKHLNTPDFLDTAAYPEMRFASERVSPLRRNLYAVTGKLTIKDVTKTVTIPVRYLGTKPHPMMPCVDASGYEAVYSLNRLEYHVGTGKFFKMGAVGDTVDMRLAGETLRKRPGCVEGK
ncbi:MAG: YceI family protein [Solidesulfovibrio sp.]|uniref:YceI family protein n=1 Tax=Solidesulfovibrio sp. TaxID=2910990 RepID=UPI002B1F837D|nr:YceI family protein [Solidesulfovibrio sp.]MEA4856823.1 YceI family protein [Solidesulfovibrio sp.]